MKYFSVCYFFFFNFKGSPDIPRNIYVNCDKPFEAKVHWTAGFDGGGNQTFFVLFSQQDWSTYKLSSTFVNGRRGDNKFITISDLQPNVKHEFKVYARNIYGNVSSTSFYCIIQGKFCPMICIYYMYNLRYVNDVL